MDPRRPRYGFSLAELVAGDRSSSSSDGSGDGEEEDDSDDEEEVEHASGAAMQAEAAAPSGAASAAGDTGGGQLLLLYDADVDAKDEAWVERKFLQGQKDHFQRLSCPGCFVTVCFDAKPSSRPMLYSATRAVNCTVDRRLPNADGSFALGCRECGAPIGRVLAEGGYVFESVLGSILES